MNTLTYGGDLLLTLLLHVGAAASICAWLARSATFRKVLFTELRDSDQKLKLLLFVTPPLAFGVILRIVGRPYRAADLMLEGSFLLGLLGGRVVGPLGGSIISLPAFFHHEWLSMPVAAAAGLVGGLIRLTVPNTEEIWKLGPFTFMSTPRWLMCLYRRKKVSWEMLPLGALVVLELGRQALGLATKPQWLFYLDVGKGWGIALVLLSTVMAVAVPMKIWNNTRIEMNLEQHQQLLLKARMDALTAQINPHFLFNTLNTVSSLIRYDPDTARGVVIKLSNILRRLLRKHETFVPLQEELDFIDDYLDIEVARFGHDNLQIHKHIDERTLDAFVPSMFLQPIVENALKHGLAAKLGVGELNISTATQDGRLVITIEDNGVGISKERMAKVYQDGIGISNVHERLRVLYGADFKMDISSREGEGTRIQIEIPELIPATHEVPLILPATKV
ncbi:MAG: histidine kinase [Acidobacteriia bacterium]|nr:histidine kinase [Terriglobia bacterium]